MWRSAVRIASAEDTGPGTLEQFQNVLPHLPLPPLDETLQTFVASVDPLLDDAGRAELRQAVADFTDSGVAARLQERLMARRAECENWLTDYWERYAYLTDRRSLLNSIVCVLDAETPPRPGISQHERAATMILAMLSFYRRLRDGGIHPQRDRGAPLCMKQFRRIFATVRRPGIDCDAIDHFEDQRCIVVLANGHYYELEVLLGAEGRTIGYGALLARIDEIVAHAALHPPGPPIGALTFLQRDAWAQVRPRLLDDAEHNAESLARIERALFLIVLDEQMPSSPSALAHAMLCGTGTNRWLDKSATGVVFANGRAGVVMEHSWGDGEAAALCLEEVLLFERRMPGVFRTPPTAASPPPRHLEFKIAKGSALDWALGSAVEHARRLIDDAELYARDLDGVGAGAIKANDCSPDSFMQIAFQLAYARCHSDRGPCLTYETAATRLFAAGRTECIRSTSVESIAFVRAMMDPTATDDQRLVLLRAALITHRSYRIAAKRGHGCDRHLLGLEIEAQHGGEDVELFRTTAWRMPFEVSTSQAPVRQTSEWYPEASLWGLAFLPTSPTGYGVCYAFPGDRRVNLVVTASRACGQTSAKLFADAIADAATDMLAVIGLTSSKGHPGKPIDRWRSGRVHRSFRTGMPVSGS